MKTKFTRYSRASARGYTTWRFFVLFLSFFAYNAFFSQTTEEFSVPGNFTWTPPCDVTTITVETWGAGGGGGGTDFILFGGTRRGGGGGGGGYSRSILTVSPGTSYVVSVGNGGTGGSSANGGVGGSSTFGGTAVVAKGGNGGSLGTGGATTLTLGATAAGGTGTVKYSGGNSNATNTRSGSGGGGAGNGGNGFNSTATSGGAGGIGVIPGGAGAAGVQNTNDGLPGNVPGGGGSGSSSTGTWGANGGKGGNGLIRITYTSNLPTSYCVKPISNVEPITNVTFAGIVNTTFNSTTAPANENFCTPVATVNQGVIYPISLKGNTYGNFTNYFTVFIDWNRNGIFENNATEMYEVGYIMNSTGTDTKVATSSISVPITATVGSTKMRVVKNFNVSNTDACNSITYGQTEDYVVVVNPAVPCTGIPTPGTLTLAPNTGATNSTFTGTITGATSAVGLTYQWQIAAAATGPWIDIPGATNATQLLTAVSVPNTTKHYRRKIICAASSSEAISNVASFKTNAVTYCLGQTTAREDLLYINNVSFVGTLADWSNVSTSVLNGYNDFTATGTAVQADGSVVNINATAAGNKLGRGAWKAWVDWNGDGDFTDAGELVYSNYGFIAPNVSFGFIIPSGTASGKYRLRIRINDYLYNNVEYLGDDYGPCVNFTSSSANNGNFGETEDYSISVIYNCPASISAINVTTGDGERCNTGKVMLSATGNGVSYKWYTAETGGSPISGQTGSTYETPSISTSRFYYVTTISAGGCESVYRTPVYARINPAPVVTFITSAASICGDETPKIEVASSGDKRESTLLEENFTTTAPNVLGKFDAIPGSAFNDPNGNWNNRPSPFQATNPPYPILSPALSSGYNGGNFAGIVTDLQRQISLLNHMVLRGNYNTTDYINLKLDFDYFYYANSTDATDAYFKIDYSTDGGSTWVNLSTITDNTINTTHWVKKTISLPAEALNSTQFKIRFSSFADADTVDGWNANIVSIDNVRIYGDKPVNTAFTWTGATSVLYEADCTTPLTSASNSICINPTKAQKENDVSWTLTATASFNSGCNATKTVTVLNDSKYFTGLTSNNWSTAANWKPSTGQPSALKCVVLKVPTNITGNALALAKNIKIETADGATGQLTISGALTVNDVINNTGTARNLVVKSDGNLLQVDNNTVNATPIAVRRLFSWSTGTLRKEYNYLSSPVFNQNMKAIFGGDANNVPFVTVLNESTNTFINAKLTDYLIPAKGFAVKEPKSIYNGVPAEGISNKEAEYKGIPNNGTVTLPLAWSSANRGYNVAGNPYPSNIDIVALYNNSLLENPINSTALDPNFRFWDNKVNQTYTQMGSSYAGYGYAIFNAVSQEGIYAPGSDPGYPVPGPNTPVGTITPNRIVKVDQAFMVRALGSGATLNFTNTIRKTDRNIIFFGKKSPRNTYHLELITSAGLGLQNAVVYMESGSSSYGKEDTKLPNSSASDALFSFADNAKIVINGRDLFTSEDVIPLGTRHFTSGTYHIRATDLSGVFANGQTIYLKDKQLGIITDISAGVYTFSSTSGEFTNRFEIVYKEGAVLANENSTKSKLEVYRDGLDFVIRATEYILDTIELYDASGRLVLTLKGKSKEIRFSSDRLVEGMYILKTRLQNGEILIKKIRK